MVESEALVEWIIEEGVNKAVRRAKLESDLFPEIDANLDWGLNEMHRLMPYLNHIGEQMPDAEEEAEQFLLELQRDEYLQSHHVTYLYRTYVE